MIDPVALTRELIRFNTMNPPGQEEPCAQHLAQLLDGHGFEVGHHALATGRTSLVARWHGEDRGLPPLAFTGHLDTGGHAGGRSIRLRPTSATTGSMGGAYPT